MMFNQYIYDQIDDEGKIQHIRQALLSDPNSIISRIFTTSKDEEILTQALSRLDENNNTLLHLAVEKNDIILVKYLLSRLEINPFLKNRNDQTAWSLSKNQEITNCLIENHVLIGVDGTFSKEVLNNKIAIGKKIRFSGDPQNPPKCLRDYSSFNDYIALPQEKALLLNRLQQYLRANEATQNSTKLFVQKIYNSLTFQNSYNLSQVDVEIDAEDSNKKLTYEEKKAKLKSEVEELNQLLGHYQGELDRCAKHRTSITQMRGSSGGGPGTPMNMDPAVACFCIAVLAVFCLASWLSEEDQDNDLTKLNQDERNIIEKLLVSLNSYYVLPLLTADHQTAVKLIRQAREDSKNRLETFVRQVPRAPELGFYGIKKRPLTINQNFNSQIQPNNSPNANENTPLVKYSSR